MTIPLIILAYVVNVFVNRWLNKIDHKNHGGIYPVTWFFPLLYPIALMVSWLEEKVKFPNNWFTGKHW